MQHPLELISKRYPQLSLQVRSGMKDTELYRSIVLRGNRSNLVLDGFSFSENDSLTTMETSAGLIDVLFLYERKDFERCIQALAYQCEPKIVPLSMGAATISGLINWEKIDEYKKRHLDLGRDNWNSEFTRIAKTYTSYRDSIIVISNGYYSAVPADKIGLSEKDWLQKSIIIRTYHELAHFVAHKLYPVKSDAIFDEVIADACGIIKAFGYYSSFVARTVLGIENDEYREGGRLENYINSNDDIGKSIQEANVIIDWLSSEINNLKM